MLQFPIKETKNIELGHPLQEFLEKNYSCTPDVKTACADLSKHRVAYYNALRSNEPIDRIRTTFTTYIAQLRGIASRITFATGSVVSSGGNGFFGMFGGKDASAGTSTDSTSLAIDFVYFDPFKTKAKKSYASSNVNFEIANCYYNFAASLTRAALNVYSPTQDAGITQACKLYKEAGGIFYWMSQQPEFQQLGDSGSPDLGVGFLYSISLICLGYAQKMFPQKSVLKGISAKTTATLFAGTAQCFQDALAAASSSPKTAAYLLTLELDLNHVIKYQIQLNTACANFYFSKVQFQAAKYGDELGFLYCAQSNANNATQYFSTIGTLDPTAAADRQKLAQEIAERLAQAEKDNNTIYFNQIPDELPLVEPKVMATFEDVSSLVEIAPSQGAFGQLANPAVIAAADRFAQEATTFINTVEFGVGALSNVARDELQSLRLPASIEALDMPAPTSKAAATEGLLPDDLWREIQAMQSAGGVDALARQYKRGQDGDAYIVSQLRQIRKLLSDDASEDLALRTQYGPRWSMAVSEEAGKQYYTACDTIGQLCQDANKGNSTCQGELDQLRSAIAIYSHASRQDIEQRLAQASQRDAAGTQQPQTRNPLASHPIVAELRNDLQQLSALFARREELIASAKQDIGVQKQALLSQLESTSDYDATVKTALDSFFAKHSEELHKEKQEPAQKHLLDKVRQDNSTFESVLKQQQHQQSFNVASAEALAEIHHVLTQYRRTSTHVKQCDSFYRDLIMDTVEPLHKRVTQWLISRRDERQITVESLTSRGGNGNNGTPTNNTGYPGQYANPSRQVSQPTNYAAAYSNYTPAYNPPTQQQPLPAPGYSYSSSSTYYSNSIAPRPYSYGYPPPSNMPPPTYNPPRRY